MEKINKKKDTLYRDPIDAVKDFEFNDQVAQVFDDMLNRSIPGYPTIIEMISVLAAQYAKPKSIVYDLGCSHGALTALLKTKITQEGCRIIAVDNSPHLMEQCKAHLGLILKGLPVEFLCDDVCNVLFHEASVVVMNFILQFIEENKKEALLGNIYKGLNPQGVLILSEKIKFPDEAGGQWQIQQHHAFKKNQGYSDLEIAQKQKSLENVLRMNSLEEHQRRLKKIGFRDVYLWYQCFNFISLVAVKP